MSTAPLRAAPLRTQSPQTAPDRMPSPASRPAGSPRYRSQTGSMLALILAAAVSVLLGLALLYGWMMQASETYRKVSLARMLDKEQKRAADLRQAYARALSGTQVKRFAAGLGMIPAETKEIYTLPQREKVSDTDGGQRPFTQ